MDFHPITEKYPAFSERQFAELCEDIQEHGLRVPIVLWNGQIIDGRHREQACFRTGATVHYTTWNGDEADLEAYVDSLNRHRRHLTPEELEERRTKRVTRIAEKRGEGKSTRQIAEEEGVSQSQVMRDLDSARSTEPGGSVEPPEGKVTGRDGRKRTASPKKHEGRSTSEKAAQRIHRQNGKPLFDDRKIDTLYGQLLRAFDDRAKVHGKEGGYHDVNAEMETLLAAWRRWQKDTTGGRKSA